MMTRKMVGLPSIIILAVISVTCERPSYAGSPQDVQGVQQQPVETSEPVVSRGVEGDIVTFSMTNISAKAIRGYVFIVDTFDLNGKSLGGPICSTEKAPSPGSKGEYSPGERWTENVELAVRLTDGTPLITASARITLDYVLFADGTGWGPNKSKQAVALGRIRQGVLHERDRLRTLLQTKGVQALLDDLACELPPR